jgi:hypothetical protein
MTVARYAFLGCIISGFYFSVKGMYTGISGVLTERRRELEILHASGVTRLIIQIPVKLFVKRLSFNSQFM